MTMELNPTMDWQLTFHQRKAQLAKSWDEIGELTRRKRLERVVAYSAIMQVEEL